MVDLKGMITARLSLPQSSVLPPISLPPFNSFPDPPPTLLEYPTLCSLSHQTPLLGLSPLAHPMLSLLEKTYSPICPPSLLLDHIHHLAYSLPGFGTPTIHPFTTPAPHSAYGLRG